MLNIEPQKVRQILTEIKHFQEKVDEYPKLTTEKDTPLILSDPEYQNMLTTINNLPPNQQATLVALMYLGHGDFKKNEWNEAFNIAQNQLTRHIGQYLLSQPNVVNCIENGLNVLGFTKN
ncbi:DUF3775 domain-containing protein [Legionella micdadei]|uniref:DUF3775 domain-containing protein n=1 Tax=Legionella micdadei TaxID=451 RepID=A0A098GC05_LEGMI|nr:DUF3775 domain-containing protein [Legionella micdadei]ARG98309.1 hypothetical protein B6N58_11910 [Legionella micdadei]ARH01061.1 hypothetical protein B6V88_11920 [Legionella micdadei]KTD27241.1 hypothetical protein Lmic_2176 [Legionella micdadei]NSL18628.1 DUF3775 domain-containing protein [Legionella micdadei]CEG60019.1 conserved protein of unknown function [Legionella micdadei]